MASDRNFDTLAERFEKQIYGTDKGRIRTTLILDDLKHHIDWLQPTSTPTINSRHIVDAGGGTGLFCANLVKSTEHTVTLCDISTEMLKRAKTNFEVIAPASTVKFHHLPAQQLPETLEQPADLVLFHAVIEWLENPQHVVQSLAQTVKPGGWFSVLFYNRQSLIWRHLMMGNFIYTNNDNVRLQGNGKTLTPDNPQEPETVQQWLINEGLEVKAWTGIRTIHDNMRPHDRERSSFEDILEAERIYGRREPYRNLARYIHFLCRKPE